MNPAADTSREFFERLYANGDPWNFAGDPYEQARYAAIVGSLGAERFRRALEPGCSVGVLTEQLAHHCDEVQAADLSQAAVDEARKRCAALRNVTIVQASVEELKLDGHFDLIVLSEIGYYFTPVRLTLWADRLLAHLAPGGTLLAAHWLGHSPDHVISGDDVHATLHELTAQRGLWKQDEQRNERFRLDLWRRDENL